MKRNNLRILFLICLPLACWLGGCGPFIAWVANAFAPPQKVPALYRPPSGKKFLVFVDDILNPVGYEPIKSELTRGLNRQLKDSRIAADAVSYEDVLTLKSSTPEFNRLSVSEIGQKLGADIVLYVKIDRFSLKDNEATPLWQGRLHTTVRLVAVGVGRLWPDDRPEGYPVEPLEPPAETHPSPNYGEVLSKALAQQMAERITNLFCDHEISAAEAREMGRDKER